MALPASFSADCAQKLCIISNKRLSLEYLKKTRYSCGGLELGIHSLLPPLRASLAMKHVEKRLEDSPHIWVLLTVWSNQPLAYHCVSILCILFKNLQVQNTCGISFGVTHDVDCCHHRVQDLSTCWNTLTKFKAICTSLLCAPC